LLAALREYYRWMRPEIYLFPSTVNHSRADKPIAAKVVWQAVREACTRGGVVPNQTQIPRRSYLASYAEFGPV
jgi:hypothetical protein